MYRYLWLLMVCLPVAAGAQTAAPEQVGALDDGGRTAPATHECSSGHKILTRQISLQNSVQQYAFRYSGCTEAVHDGEHPSAEGNFGMPSPCACNWYHSGFLTINLNGKDAVRRDLKEMRVIDSGERGAFQVTWLHPDAEVSLRVVLLPGANHVLCLLRWQPREGAVLKNVTVGLRCYPSFFTAARQRRGERHVKTPRTDVAEPGTLTITPGQDPWLYYYDRVFDMARGEGDGPCAAVVEQTGLQGGKVSVGDYAVMTSLEARPAACSLRFGLYDFGGSTNAAAEQYLQAHGGEDLAQLVSLDFRPGAVRTLDYPALKAEAEQLLADAAEDGAALRPKVDKVVQQLGDLAAKGQGGDWQAEAELATVIRGSQDLLWKLRTYALLNRPVK